MIELLKYLANNLEPEQLLEVAYIISHNPDMISQEEFMEHKKKKEQESINKLLRDNNISLN